MTNLFDLQGRTALVTGASSGFGWYFAQVLAQAGANVVLCARRTDRLKQLCDKISEQGGSALAAKLDVTDPSSLHVVFDQAERQFGIVTILVNNAGVSRAGLLLNLKEEDWDPVMDTNLKAVWMVGREAAVRMAATNKPGTIINIASLLAFGTGKSLGSYMAAKAGVIHLTRSMALEWAPLNIRVNAIAPGYFPTEMTGNYFATPKGREMIGRIPQQRVGVIQELAGPLLLLASDASSYMTGSVLTVDGGHLCSSL
jgi:NAD(P)-dependent dehydrogenase (short-subunit alcohol dehydrogenase family)